MPAKNGLRETQARGGWLSVALGLIRSLGLILALGLIGLPGCGDASLTPVEPGEEPFVLQLPPEDDDGTPGSNDRPRRRSTPPPHQPTTASTADVAHESRAPAWARPNLRPGESLRLLRVITQTVEQTDDQGPAGTATAVTEYHLDLLCEGETLPPVARHPAPVPPVPTVPPLPTAPPATPQPPGDASETPPPATAQQYRLTIVRTRHEVQWSDAASSVAPPAAAATDAPADAVDEEPAPAPLGAPVHFRFWLGDTGEIVAAERCVELADVPRRLSSPRVATSPASQAKPVAPAAEAPVDGGLQLLQNDPHGGLADWLCLIPVPADSPLAPWREIRNVAGPVACRKTSEYRVRELPGHDEEVVQWRANLTPPTVRLAGGTVAPEWQLIDGSEAGEIRLSPPHNWPGAITQRQTVRLLTQLEDGRPLWQTKHVTVVLKDQDGSAP